MRRGADARQIQLSHEARRAPTARCKDFKRRLGPTTQSRALRRAEPQDIRLALAEIPRRSLWRRNHPCELG
jgi:hypothetical protein